MLSGPRVNDSIALSEPTPSPHHLGVLAFVHHLAGDETATREVLTRLLDQYESAVGMAYAIARAYGSLGQTDSAFEWLEKAFSDKEWPATWITVDPLAAGLRSDPRYESYVERLNLPD